VVTNYLMLFQFILYGRRLGRNQHGVNRDASRSRRDDTQTHARKDTGIVSYNAHSLETERKYKH